MFRIRKAGDPARCADAQDAGADDVVQLRKLCLSRTFGEEKHVQRKLPLFLQSNIKSKA